METDIIKKLFSEFPELVQRVICAYGFDPYHFRVCGLGNILYEEYENVRKHLLGMCENNIELKTKVLDYLIKIYD